MKKTNSTNTFPPSTLFDLISLNSAGEQGLWSVHKYCDSVTQCSLSVLAAVWGSLTWNVIVPQLMLHGLLTGCSSSSTVPVASYHRAHPSRLLQHGFSQAEDLAWAMLQRGLSLSILGHILCCTVHMSMTAHLLCAVPIGLLHFEPLLGCTELLLHSTMSISCPLSALTFMSAVLLLSL